MNLVWRVVAECTRDDFERWKLCVHDVVVSHGQEPVRAERTHHVGRAGAENPAGKASNGPERVTGTVNALRTRDVRSFAAALGGVPRERVTAPWIGSGMGLT